jgi:hypothetical protein
MHSIPGLSPEAESIPWLTTEQMVEVDRAMVEDFRVLLLQMMEHAGRHLAHLARERFLSGDARGREVVVLAGPGGNGGGALVCARRLAAWGARVVVAVTADDERFAEVPRHQLDSTSPTSGCLRSSTGGHRWASTSPACLPKRTWSASGSDAQIALNAYAVPRSTGR